jgi:calcium-dependent protein kinase
MVDGITSSSSSSGVNGGSSSSSERPLDDTLVQRLQRYGTYGRFKQVGRVLCMLCATAAAYAHRLLSLPTTPFDIADVCTYPSVSCSRRSSTWQFPPTVPPFDI